MLDLPHVVDAEPVAEFDLSERVLDQPALGILAPGLRQLMFVEHAEFHRVSSRPRICQPRPGAMNSHGAYSCVMSVITSISAGAFAASASRSASRSPSASVHAPGRHAEALGVDLEIRIAQLGAGIAALEQPALIAQHVAVGRVVEQHGDQVDAELHRGRQFRATEQEAAIAGQRHHRPVRHRHLDAERGRKAGAERAGEARRDQRARRMERKAEPRDVADLRHLVAQDAVLRQHVADRFEERHLRLHLLDRLRGLRLGARDRLGARRVVARRDRRRRARAPHRRCRRRSAHRPAGGASRPDRCRCARPSGRRAAAPQRDIGTSSRVPNATSRSVCGHSL